jgi:DNA-binding MarR family transcriptional regulator
MMKNRESDSFSPLLMPRLLSAVYWFDDALQDALKRGGFEPMTRAQSLLLSNISAGEHRAIRLARNLGITRQAVSSMIMELQSLNILVVEQDTKDRRARVVKFAPSAAPLAYAAHRALEQVEAVLRERIGPDRYEGIKAGLSADWGAPPIVDLPEFYKQ